MPVNLPQIDVLSIGAGGGSIARVDAFGALAVGPASAGAEPGPAAYGRGGADATVTDAHVVLGTLADGRARSAGRVPLDRDAAARGGRQRASPARSGSASRQAAAAILRVANANMANALRVVSVARGHDPRGFALVAIGGAGPMHACALADELGVPRVVVPRYPGVAAALGLLRHRRPPRPAPRAGCGRPPTVDARRARRRARAAARPRRRAAARASAAGAAVELASSSTCATAARPTTSRCRSPRPVDGRDAGRGRAAFAAAAPAALRLHAGRHRDGDRHAAAARARRTTPELDWAAGERRRRPRRRRRRSATAAAASRRRGQRDALGAGRRARGRADRRAGGRDGRGPAGLARPRRRGRHARC